MRVSRQAERTIRIRFHKVLGIIQQGGKLNANNSDKGDRENYTGN